MVLDGRSVLKRPSKIVLNGNRRPSLPSLWSSVINQRQNNFGLKLSAKDAGSCVVVWFPAKKTGGAKAVTACFADAMR